MTVALAFVLAVSAGCAGPRPLPAESTPTATSDGRCPALGPLADVCGTVFSSTQIKGGESNWGDLPALRLTLSATPDDQTPYVSIKTGVNITMTRVDVTTDQLKPRETTAISAVGHAEGGEAEGARENWVTDFTSSNMQWELSKDRGQLTLASNDHAITFANA
ncbi:MAG: hypothetical protein IT193_04670 [Propionibacteriaceae bacterium]|nr:hypothetical protein [Propionibacteriaceae bacterium]